MSNPALSDIIQRITASAPPPPMTTKIIAIDGCGGAGKTTLAWRLAANLGAQLIHTDDFASWDNALDWHGRMMAQVITPLRNNKPGRYQRYDWGTRALAEWHDVPLQPYVIIEGVSSARALFRPAYAFAIFVDTPQEERLKRGLARDGADALPLWQKWQAAEDAYLRQETPQAHVDLMLNGTRPIPDP